MIVEYIGYAGSLLWLVSLTVSNTFRLRLFNLFGATTFSLYGYLSGAYPVFVVNAMIAILDVYHLFHLTRHRGLFSLLEIPANNSGFVSAFLQYYQKEIHKHYPNLEQLSMDNHQAIFTMRNLQPVGICLYEVKAPGIIDIKLDFMSLRYKELKGIASIYASCRESWKKQGYREIMVRVANDRYKKYLNSLGYHEELSDGYTLRKILQ
jgi:hypothetical protein